jgi:hypothetical protein
MTEDKPIEKPKRFKGQSKFCQGILDNPHTFGEWQPQRLDMMTTCGKESGFIWYERRCLICNRNFFKHE